MPGLPVAHRESSDAVRHRWIDVGGVRIFYRECGPAQAPVLLLPHGYPCSSFAFRNLMPALADRWRTVAPDLPGFGYSDTPAPTAFSYTFDGYAAFLGQFVAALGLERYAIWLHDYGSQFGLRLAMAAPERVTGVIIANGDIYEDEFGPKYEPLIELWNRPVEEGRHALEQHVSEEGFRDEFVGDVAQHLVERVSPDLWSLAWAQLGTPRRRENLVQLLSDQRHTLAWFPRERAYLREHRPPALIVWGHQDGYMPADAGRAYLRDLPDADLHLIDGGHWLLETHLDEVIPLVRAFLSGLPSAAA